VWGTGVVRAESDARTTSLRLLLAMCRQTETGEKQISFGPRLIKGKTVDESSCPSADSARTGLLVLSFYFSSSHHLSFASKLRSHIR